MDAAARGGIEEPRGRRRSKSTLVVKLWLIIFGSFQREAEMALETAEMAVRTQR
jgi:hypothetical protein